MRQALRKTHRRQLIAGDGKGVGSPGKFQRHGDIFQRRHIGNEMKGLKDDADLAAAEFGDLVLAHRVDRVAVDRDFARIDPLQTGKHHQQS